MEDASGHYADDNMLGDDGSPATDVCHARGVILGLPAIWMIYHPVGDLAESLRRVREEGGRKMAKIILKILIEEKFALL